MDQSPLHTYSSNHILKIKARQFQITRIVRGRIQDGCYPIVGNSIQTPILGLHPFKILPKEMMVQQKQSVIRRNRQ